MLLCNGMTRPKNYFLMKKRNEKIKKFSAFNYGYGVLFQNECILNFLFFLL